LTVSPGRIGQLTGTVSRSCSPLTKRVTMTVWRKARGAKPPAIRHRGLDGHVRDIRILARLNDLAQDKERPIGLDFDGDVRLADVPLPAACRRFAAKVRWSSPRAPAPNR
jgi:hypothetical protein